MHDKPNHKNIAPIAPDEIWENVPGYDGDYMISNYGRVMSLKRKKAKLLRSDNKRGYKQVQLFKDGIGEVVRVHRLVATMFIPNPKNKPCINHKDRNTRNNHVSNLEWCTQYENVQHAYGFPDKRKYLRTRKSSKLTLEQIATIRSNRAGLSQVEMARKYKVCEATISRIVRRMIHKTPYIDIYSEKSSEQRFLYRVEGIGIDRCDKEA